MMRRGGWLVSWALLGMFAFATVAEAQEVSSVVSRAGRFVFGGSLGFQTGTVDDTAVAVGLGLDYYLTDNFSIGPLVQLGTTSDLLQLGVSVQAKYTFDLAGLPALKPHVEAGLGLLTTDLDRPGGGQDDTSYLIPLGVGLEYRLTPRVSLDTTLLFNFTNLDVESDSFFVTWFLGVRIPF